MSGRQLFVIVWIIVFLLVLLGDPGLARSQVPAGQPHPDIFEAAGVTNMQTLNPLTVKSKAQHTGSYRLLVMPGCVAGSIESDMRAIETEAKKVGYALVRNDSSYNFTVRLNCGSEQQRICGSVTVFCLGRGFPYNPDVELSDIMYAPIAYPLVSRLSIILHEILGHAVSTWNEQYCIGGETSGICKGLPQFTSTPGWHDFMNTGPESRHLFESVELARWERTMYSLSSQTACSGDPCFDGQRWLFSSGWSYSPTTDQWFDPTGRLFWEARASWGGRHSPVMSTWLQPGTPYFRDDLGVWNTAP